MDYIPFIFGTTIRVNGNQSGRKKLLDGERYGYCMKKYVFGVDIGGTTCKLGMFETSGSLRHKWEIPTDTSASGDHILDDVAQTIEEKLIEQGIPKEEVEGIGVGIPGPVKSKGLVEACVNLGWKNVDVENELRGRTGLRVKAGNDANVAAMGEMWQGAAKGHDNVLMVTLGTGTGGAVIVDRHMVSGAHGAGGEIGHITVNRDETEQCGCGQRGCLEQYASATAIVRLTEKKLKEDFIEAKNSCLFDKKDLSARDVLDAAKKGDHIAILIVDEMCEALGFALSNIACVSDPEIILIGGGVSKAGTFLLDCIKRHYDKNAFFICKDVEFALASLENDAGIYGGACLLLES